MPLNDDYRDMIKSSIADIINSTGSRSAGACTAAAFLSHFVPKKTPFMHIDIGGAFYAPKLMGIYEKGMSGTGPCLPHGRRQRAPWGLTVKATSPSILIFAGRPTRFLIEMLNVLAPKDRDGVPRDDGSAVPEWKFGEAQLSDSDDDGHLDEADAEDGAPSVSVAPFSAVTGAPARAGEDAAAARSTDWVDVKLSPGNATARTAASRQSKVFGFTSSTKGSRAAPRKGSGSPRRAPEAAEDAAEPSAGTPSAATAAEPAPPAASTLPADVTSPPDAPAAPPATEVDSAPNGANAAETTQPQSSSSSPSSSSSSSSSPERL